MSATQVTTKAPPVATMLAEWPRGAGAVVRLGLQWHVVGRGARGDGRPVMVLPGLCTTDASNFVLVRHLNALGYRTSGWGLGRNLGERTVGRDAQRLVAAVEARVAETGARVTLIGISLGGIMARLLAKRRPDLVREVITISAPFAGPPTATNVWRAFEWLTGAAITDPHVVAMGEEAAGPMPVPATAIWSASDGLVAGSICYEDADRAGTRAIRVQSSHVGVQFQPRVLRAVAEVLAGDDSGERKAA